MEIKNPVPDDERTIIWPLVGDRMLELGNKKNADGVYKHYFESVGIGHTSIDWNGQDGALNLDLRKPISVVGDSWEVDGQGPHMHAFDMVTNIGTTEHVSDQEAVWLNIHNLTKIGGVIASLTPLEGDWWWHGEYYPRFEFFLQFAQNGYRVEYLDIGREHPNRNVCCRLKKIAHNDFVMPDPETMFYNRMRAR